MASRKLERVCCLALSVLASGCAGPTMGRVSLRADGTPGPEQCSEEALEAMRYLRLPVGAGALVEFDVNQGDAEPVTLYEGRVESMLLSDLGPLDSPTRLYGYVWTSGPQVVIRYYEARPPNSEARVPICAVVRMAKGQMRKLSDSPAGIAVLKYSRGGVFIVDKFL
ncbi:MAG: serine/threonine protein kinase [Myxococcaceae bacterium]|nr:MAG: serine/threonine protein kinase [Myxococcaceae bacterium]